MEMNEWDSGGFHGGVRSGWRVHGTPTLENIFEAFAKALKCCHLVESLIFFFFILPYNHLFWASKWEK